MINFENASVRSVATARPMVPGSAISNYSSVQLSGEEESALKQFAFRPFRESDVHAISDHTGSVSRAIDRGFSDLGEAVPFLASAFAGLNLEGFERSVMLVVNFKDVLLDDELVQGIGVYICSGEGWFISDLDAPEFHLQQGVSLRKPHFAALLLNAMADEGYRVFLNDKGITNDAWKIDFLGLEEVKTKYAMTEGLMDMCRTFVKEQLPQQFELDRAAQIDILNRSSGYLKKAEEFDVHDFAEAVLEAPEMVKSFEHFKNRYNSENDIDIEDRFALSKQAVQQNSRFLKSVLKLDKNFHIYVHGNRERIERGYDPEKGLHYYKVYFDEEKN